MKPLFKKYKTRKWLLIISILLPVVVFFYSVFIEPYAIVVQHHDLPGIKNLRIVHIGDFHYHGSKKYVMRVIDLINQQNPDYVLFTGDFINESRYLDEILDLLDGLKCPILAVPGNHEFWENVNLKYIDSRLRENGGRLLQNEVFQSQFLTVIGLNEPESKMPIFPQSTGTKVLMCHYPIVVDNHVDSDRFDLILAGHTHGGQVRIPGFGAPILPYYTGDYDYGMFETKIGPMYVTSGVGWLKQIRFFCRPEIVVIE